MRQFVAPDSTKSLFLYSTRQLVHPAKIHTQIPPDRGYVRHIFIHDTADSGYGHLEFLWGYSAAQ